MRGLTRRKGGGEGVLLLWVLAAGVTANAPAYKVGAQGIEAECRTGLRCATHFKSFTLVHIHSLYNAHLQASPNIQTPAFQRPSAYTKGWRSANKFRKLQIRKFS
jgi:hypothetical protein